MTMIHSFK